MRVHLIGKITYFTFYGKESKYFTFFFLIYLLKNGEEFGAFLVG